MSRELRAAIETLTETFLPEYFVVDESRMFDLHPGTVFSIKTEGLRTSVSGINLVSKLLLPAMIQELGNNNVNPIRVFTAVFRRQEDIFETLYEMYVNTTTNELIVQKEPKFIAE